MKDGRRGCFGGIKTLGAKKSAKLWNISCRIPIKM